MSKKQKKDDWDFVRVFMADYQFDGAATVIVVISDGKKLAIEFTPSQWSAILASYERKHKGDEAA